MRLLFSGIGFSAAYFLDPEQGAARRKSAVEAFHRAKQAIAHARAVDDQPRSGTGPRTTASSATVESRFTGNGLSSSR